LPSLRTLPLAAALAAFLFVHASHARDIPTTYGEDPVPETYLSLQPPYTAYGMDPIPVVSPLERWLEWRAYRQQKQQMRERRPASSVNDGWKFWRRWP